MSDEPGTRELGILVSELAWRLRGREGAPGAPLTVTELQREFLPYPRCREAADLATKAEYDQVMLELLADPRLLEVESPDVRDAVERELESMEPALEILEMYADAELRPGPDLWDRAAAARAAREEGEDEEEPEETHEEDETDEEAASGPEEEEPPEEDEQEDEADESEADEPDEDEPVEEEPAEEDQPEVAVKVVPEPEEEEEGAAGDAAASEPAEEEATMDEEATEAESEEAGSEDEETGAGESTCVHCGHDLPDRAEVRFCPWCGTDQHSPQCPECGEVLEEGWRYCPACGQEAED